MQLTGFDGRVAVVTGAGRMRSIGREIAVELARAGCDVVITGTGRAVRRPDELAAGWRDIESVAEQIRQLGRRALPVVCDVTDEADVERLAAGVLAEFGHVDFLINNAGSAIGDDRRPVVDLEPSEWKAVIDVNLNGTFLMSRRFGREMARAAAGGAIVNISSVAGKVLPPNSAAYATSKAAIHALTACMAQEVASTGVRVNALCPGYVETSRLDGIERDQAWKETLARIPLGRMGTPADVSSAVLFLCSDQGAWVTGQAWNVDGGVAVQH